MNKEYNLAGKNLLVDGITILGTRKSSKGVQMTNAINSGTVRKQTNEKIRNTEEEIAELEEDTQRYDLSCNQSAIIRDDAKLGYQIVVLSAAIVGYEAPNPRITVQSAETMPRICALEENPDAETIADIQALEPGDEINPMPDTSGSWYRGGLLFHEGDQAAYLLNAGSNYITVIMEVTSVSDTSVTGDVISVIYSAKGIDDRDMTHVVLYIPLKHAGQLEAFLYDGVTLMDRLTVPVTNQTRRWKELKPVDDIRVLNALTASDDDQYIDGDCCIVRFEYDAVTGNYDNCQFNTYIYKSGVWELANDDDAAQQIQTIYTYMAEAGEYQKQHPSFNYQDTVTGNKGVFGKLMAGILYAGRIFANEILSSNWDGEEDGFPKQGFRLSTMQNMIEAYAAKLVGAQIKKSDLNDVNITTESTINGETVTLFKTTKAITPPASAITMTSASGYYVEAANLQRYFDWLYPNSSTSNRLYQRNETFKYEPTAVDVDAEVTFTVKNACTILFRAPQDNSLVLSGTPGNVTITVERNRNGSITTLSDTQRRCGNPAPLAYVLMDFQYGDVVTVSITYTTGTASVFRLKTWPSSIAITRWLDQRTNTWYGASGSATPIAADAFCSSDEADVIVGSSTTHFNIYFPVVKYEELYVASSFSSAFVVAGNLVSGLATLVQDEYNAIAQLLNARGTQVDPDDVDAIPRGTLVDLKYGDAQAISKVTYKRVEITVDQILLTDAYASFFYQGNEVCTLTSEENAQAAYTIYLDTVHPSLTVADLKPTKPGVTDIGASDQPFDNAHVNTVHAASIVKPAAAGSRLDITADSFSGPLTGNVTGDVTGNVNSSGTTKKVYGAVFN